MGSHPEPSLQEGVDGVGWAYSSKCRTAWAGPGLWGGVSRCPVSASGVNLCRERWLGRRGSEEGGGGLRLGYQPGEGTPMRSHCPHL